MKTKTKKKTPGDAKPPTAETKAARLKLKRETLRFLTAVSQNEELLYEGESTEACSRAAEDGEWPTTCKQFARVWKVLTPVLRAAD